MHDRHAGPAVTVPPVYGDDSDSDAVPDLCDESSDDDLVAGSQTAFAVSGDAMVQVMTWNVNGPALGTGDVSFLRQAALSVDVLCMQEVSPAMVRALRRRQGRPNACP